MDIRSWSCSGKDVIRLGRPRAHEDDVVPESFTRCCSSIISERRWWWRAAWSRLVGSRRILERRSTRPGKRRRGYYDAYTYAQNFDQGRAWDEEEPENLSRSFSMRFADPSRLRLLQQQVAMLD